MPLKEPPCIEVSEEEFNEILNSNSNKLIVVNFFAEWHMPSLIFFPLIDELAEKLKEVKFLKINIDDNENLVKKYEITSLPTTIFFKNSKEIERIIKCDSIELIEEKIKNYLK